MIDRFNLIIAAILATLLTSTAALACDMSKLPTPEQKNIWYCHSSSDTVIVFVHGLFSNSREAWLREGAAPTDPPKAFWPQIAVDDQRLGGAAIFLGGFYSKLDTKDFGVREASNELFSGLSTPIDGNAPVLDQKNIIFVAHSLGGVVVRDLLVRHTEAFKEKRVGLLLVASPTGGSAYARLAEYMPTVSGGALIDQLQPNSTYLRGLDLDFRDLLNNRKIPSLTGKELVEHFAFDPNSPATASWYKRLANYFVDDKIVPRQSASRYFPNEALIPDSDHSSIAKPEGQNSDAHLQLVNLYEQVQSTTAPECAAPPYFKVQLDLAVAQASNKVQDGQAAALANYLPVISVERLDKDGHKLIGTTNVAVMRDPQSGLHEYAPSPPFPCSGEIFQARFRAAPISGGSFLTENAADATSLCFKRSRSKSNERTAALRCVEGQTCSVAPNAGMAEACNERAGLDFSTGFITPAHAEPHPASAEEETYGRQWMVPSLDTIQKVPAELRAGYTEFGIKTLPLKGVEHATHFTYGVRVNGIPLHFDGWPPFSNETLFSGADGLKLAFAVENLGFSGGQDGHENIEVELRIFDNQTLLRTEVLKRDDYVSYRHADQRELALSQGEEAVWTGLYRPAASQDRFEIILATAGQAPKIMQDRKDIQNRVAYEDHPVIGVIRPGRTDNPQLGLSFGLKLKSGQVRSVFSKEQATNICRFVIDQAQAKKLPRWLSKSAYIYEFDTERITDTADRGVYRGTCQKLLAQNAR